MYIRCTVQTVENASLLFDRSDYRPHPTHEMRIIAIDDPGVCQSIKRLHCAITAERIEIMFRAKPLGDPRNI